MVKIEKIKYIALNILNYYFKKVII